MHSKHGITLALLLGAFALIFIIIGILFLEFSTLSLDPSVAPPVKSPVTVTPSGKPPRFQTKIEGSDDVIAEVDNNGNTVKAIYTSSLTDKLSDFSVFAVPQTHYQGIIYIRALGDDTAPELKIYPLNVTTGTLGKAVVNQPYDSFVLSEDQESVTITVKGISTSYNIVN
jgi:hypothetical protein